jgi:hypothetical protein
MLDAQETNMLKKMMAVYYEKNELKLTAVPNAKYYWKKCYFISDGMWLISLNLKSPAILSEVLSVRL